MDFGRMLGYTEALSKNNDRTWFHDNHRQSGAGHRRISSWYWM